MAKQKLYCPFCGKNLIDKDGSYHVYNIVKFAKSGMVCAFCKNEFSSMFKWNNIPTDIEGSKFSWSLAEEDKGEVVSVGDSEENHEGQCWSEYLGRWVWL